MKIALVAQEYFPEKARGGIGTQTHMKAQGLIALGHEVFVITRSTDEYRHETTDGKMTVIYLPGLENGLPEMTEIVQWLTRSVSVAAEIEALHKRVNIDIVDFPEWAAEGYTYLLNRTPWKSIPSVVQLHGPLVMFAHTMSWPEINSEFYRVGTAMESTCVRLADAVYSSSECSANWARDHYDPGKEQIPVVHTGVDSNKFAAQPVPKNDRPTIIFIGKIVQNKGVEELVAAACNLVKDFPGLQLKMLGRGKEELIKKLQQKAAKSGADDLLNFPGFITKDVLPDELSRAHVFAAPSYYEGGPGFVYLEAMACGMPVIGCSGSGIDEIITTGENGILVPPGNVAALETALRDILNDKDYAERLSQKAREYVIAEADSKDCLKKLESFYYSVLKPEKTI